MRKWEIAFVLLVFALFIIVLGLVSGCATTYRSGRVMKYQPFYVVSVTFAKDDTSANSADHRFILEAKWDDANAPLGYWVDYVQCDRGEPNGEYVECLFATSNPEMSFDILQVWENQRSEDPRHDGKNVAGANRYLCTNVVVGISANELRLNNNGSLDPEYVFNLPSDYDDPTCRFQISAQTMVDAKTTQANK